MARPPGTLRVGPYFLSLLALMAVLYAVVFIPGQNHTPKLGLDLQGGAQLIFKAKTTNGSTPTSASMKEAQSIITDRVNGTGVSNAEVVIQNGNLIVVSVPGARVDQLKDVGAAAQLSFRPVIAAPVALGATAATATGTPVPSGTAVTTPSGTVATTATPQSRATVSASTTPKDARQRPLTAPTPAPVKTTAPAAKTTAAKTTPAKTTPAKTTPAKTTAPAKATPTPTPTPAPTTATAPAAPKSADPLAKLTFAVPTSDTAYNALTAAQQQQIQAAMATVDCAADTRPDDATKDFVACDAKTDATSAVLLGPVIVQGTQITGASAIAPNIQQGSAQWTVNVNLNGAAQAKWSSYTGAHNSANATTNYTTCSATTLPCAEFVAFVLDGIPVSIPHNEQAINGATTNITGTVTQTASDKLADQLKYGALPLSFDIQSQSTVSASLGTSQLKAGLLAGGIGLALVVLYSLIYYRGLGFVTIASLIVSAILTYASLVILAREIGFTLTLAGIAGFIVAVGITADSFVVFFERIKDEVHEGRSMRVAVPRAWVRARRTILSADTVSFLAAAVLYYFAAGEVKGFAFTLGLSTILDLAVVFLFTHPIVSLLSRSRTFGSARFTGLDAIRGSAVAAVDMPTVVRKGSAADRARTRRAERPTTRDEEAEPSKFAGSLIVMEKDLQTDEIEEVDEDGYEADVDDDAAIEAEAQEENLPVDDDIEADTTEDVADEPDAPAASAEVEPEPAPRPKSAPQPGSAAERAAARRAKLREEKGQGR